MKRSENFKMYRVTNGFGLELLEGWKWQMLGLLSMLVPAEH